MATTKRVDGLIYVERIRLRQPNVFDMLLVATIFGFINQRSIIPILSRSITKRGGRLVFNKV
jgi:hypothetical protein